MKFARLKKSLTVAQVIEIVTWMKCGLKYEDGELWLIKLEEKS